MSIKHRVITAVMRQFGHPSGIGGTLAGWVMAGAGLVQAQAPQLLVALDNATADEPGLLDLREAVTA